MSARVSSNTVALQALTEPQPEERAAWIRSMVDANPLRLVNHGRVINDKEDLARFLGSHLDDFRATRLPKLIELGIVEATGPA